MGNTKLNEHNESNSDDFIVAQMGLVSHALMARSDGAACGSLRLDARFPVRTLDN